MKLPLLIWGLLLYYKCRTKRIITYHLINVSNAYYSEFIPTAYWIPSLDIHISTLQKLMLMKYTLFAQKIHPSFLNILHLAKYSFLPIFFIRYGSDPVFMWPARLASLIILFLIEQTTLMREQGRSQTFQNEGAARGAKGRGWLGPKMVALHRPLYKMSFHWGLGRMNFWLGGSSPPYPQAPPLWENERGGERNKQKQGHKQVQVQGNLRNDTFGA